ncbi:ABC transporter permease [Evansella cellulosilytica]|uniref:Putative exporter of polyketide antibiotics-like protein n=1 Tax=Evansella cellulosilytica (strain ATCC 21833 / DSM 2522 / FERM P-1141 / JCM 9156 / N-4) TaxID=649639 RepID=E6TWA9_EVAC2|nr:ABC transporter permease subunit [Evansella cellulosilytica]ADU31065.1 putative exporter of polyketide antibiotics-like protein [Evansella cellulosilytica DSM 2522]
MAKSLVTKTSHLSTFILKLDRIRIPLWLLGLTLFTLIVPIAYDDLYGNDQERAGIAETMANPAMTAMTGPADLENYTVGVMTAHAMLLMTAVVVGLMAILIVTRHTRADEEDGRIELIRSLPVGRLSYLNATLIVLVITSVLLTFIIGFGLYALGIETLDLQGSLLYGAALGGTCLFFGGVTAVFAQISDSSRGTIGLSIAVLLISYLFRAITDVSNDTLSWLAPLGWVTKMEVYGENNWWPLALMIGGAILLFILANYLNAIRDLERGFLPTKGGKRFASKLLLSPLGLAIRLQRTGIIAWAVGMFVLGASYGSVLGDLEAFFGDNEMMKQILADIEGASIVEQFLPMLMIVITLLATVPPIMAMNKLRGEEKKDRIDHILGRAISRNHLMGSYIVIAVINGFLMFSLAALGLWSAGDAVMEEGLSFSMIYGTMMSYFPAMLVMVAICVFFIGFLPRLTSLIWLYFLYSFMTLYLGNMFQLSDWVGKLSPFGHIPQAPVEEVTFLPLIILSLIAVLLMVVGFIGFNRRDIETS